MLVLTRREGQRVSIGAVVLVVLETRRGSVRLGFVAPHGTRIMRLELVADGDDPPPPPRRARRRRSA